MASEKWIGTTDTSFGTAGNFNPSGVPVTGDSLTVDQDAVNSIAGSDQHTIVLADLIIKAATTYNIGDNGTPLQIGATSIRIGDSGGGAAQPTFPGRINLDTGTNQFTMVVANGNVQAGTDAGKENIRIKGTHASNFLEVLNGRVGVATDNIGDTAQLDTIVVANGTTNVGSGVTLATLKQTGGTVNLGCAAATVKQSGGTLTTSGNGAIVDMTISGLASLQSTGPITSLTVLNNGSASMLADYRAKTITDVYLYRGATFSYDPSVHTITNPIHVVDGSLSDVKIITPQGINVTLAAA